MDLSIVIVNYRTPQLIINCLTTVFNFTHGLEFEVIVVDNDPENGGENLVRAEFPSVRWINMEFNSGFGRANNRGMSVAQGDYFLLLNADTLLTDGVIQRCFDRLRQRDDIMACGALQYYPNGTQMPFYQSFNEFRRTFFILPPSGFFERMLLFFFPEPRHQDPDQYDWLVGAFVFVRRKGFELTGGFSEDFFMYGEDVEWSGRLGKLGKLCIFQDCTFVHLENENPFRRTNISWINRFSTQMQVSNFLWIRKQYGILAYLLQIGHYILMIPVVYVWRIILNIKADGRPFTQLRTQHIYTRKTRILIKYFWRTLTLRKGLYKIKPSENIDLLTSYDLT